MSDSEFFKNRKEAHDWLRRNGYLISRGKFYQDCEAGLVTINADKTVSRFMVLQYGVAWQKKTTNPGGIDVPGAAEADLRKKIADAGIAERKERKLAREEDSLWLYADDAYALLAGLVAAMRGAVRHQAYSRRRELVEIIKGNPDLADQLYQEIEQLIDDGLNEVAGKDLKVKFYG